MIYFLDCEFNGFGGELISLALVRQDGESIYCVAPVSKKKCEQWVKDNVLPILWDIPSPLPGMAYKCDNTADIGRKIKTLIGNDHDPVIIADWPDDIKYFNECLITGPGMMVGIDNLTFRMVRVDSYPSKLKNAVRHNAWWDAMALKEKWMNP